MRMLSFSAIVLTFACVHPGQNEQKEYNSSVISEEEIEASRGPTAYDVIKKLRGNFLSYRGETTMRNTSTTVPVVYIDDQFFGALATLKEIQANQIAQIRLYRSWEATTKFGTGHMAGVIAITTRH